MSEEVRTGDVGFSLESSVERPVVPDILVNADKSVGVEREQTKETSQELESKLTTILSASGQMQGAAPSSGATDDDARNLSLLADIESQTTRLIDLATQKGLSHAVEVAQKMKNYYLLDQMHDTLVDKFYQGLVDKGLIERE